jgi:transcriptional regulator with XRE-family HTH domain
VLSAGKKLRDLREQMGLTLRDVELASTSLAESRGIEEFIINPSRLSDIETKGVIPSIYRLYVLSVIYRADFTELLKLYGVDLSFTAADFAICSPGKTHRLEIAAGRGNDVPTVGLYLPMPSRSAGGRTDRADDDRYRRDRPRDNRTGKRHWRR